MKNSRNSQIFLNWHVLVLPDTNLLRVAGLLALRPLTTSSLDPLTAATFTTTPWRGRTRATPSKLVAEEEEEGVTTRKT